jgi:hypothetical protein
MKIEERLRQSKFLPFNSSKGAPDWNETDTKELFENSLKRQSANWIYRNKEVRYTVNSEFYRTKEFNDIQWNDSIVIFGCSNVYGVGLDDTDTISSKLQNITGLPTVNLGANGTSMTYNFHNSVILSQGYPTPKAVVYIWPDYYRTIEYFEDSLVNYGQWNTEKNNISGAWIQNNAHARSTSILIHMAAKSIWEGKTKAYYSSFSKDTSKLLGCDNFLYIDRARDILHPGIKSAEIAAERIAKGLNL